MTITFVCCACGRRYTSNRPISELVEELRLADPGVTMEECEELAADAARGEGLICDPCYEGVGDPHYRMVH